MNIYFQFKLYDINYSLIKTTRKFKSRSFVENFHNLLHQKIGYSTDITMTNINGDNIAIKYGCLYVCHPGGVSKHWWKGSAYNTGHNALSYERGIILGTSSTAVSPTQTALASPIVYGTSVGQLIYLSSSGTDAVINGATDTGTFTLERLFYNNSGASITVNEIGISGTGIKISSNYSYDHGFLIIRDIVSPGQVIGNGQYLKAIYTLQIVS